MPYDYNDIFTGYGIFCVSIEIPTRYCKYCVLLSVNFGYFQWTKCSKKDVTFAIVHAIHLALQGMLGGTNNKIFLVRSLFKVDIELWRHTCQGANRDSFSWYV